MQESVVPIRARNTVAASISPFRVATSLRLGDRVLTRCDDGVLLAEYALFDVSDIVLRATDPVTVREVGYMTTAGEALGRLERAGVTLDMTLEAAQAPGATSHVYSLTLDPIINVPVTKVWGGYVVFGPGFYHRSGKLDSSSAIPGSACNPFEVWWGHCFNSSLPVNGRFLNASQNEFGYNFGAGITRKIRPNLDFYAEFRYMHGKHNGITTDFRPITIGIRW